MNRRHLLRRATAWGIPLVALPWPSWAQNQTRTLRFGVISDVHKDIMHDADWRLQTFIDHMKAEKVDFIVQLGDFCIPKKANAGFLNIWNGFPGPRYHVLGNHDTDGGYQREQTVEWWKMPDRFYSFDQNGIRLIVLDGNDRPQNHRGGYPRFIADDQLKWLDEQIASTQSPIIVLSHQSLERESQGGVQNGGAVRKLLEAANQRAGRRQVVACFSGHHHRDYVRQINDIVYPQINSASYHWVGADYQHVRFSKEVDQSHPNNKKTVPYKDPLFAIVTIDPVKGFLSIQGKSSRFVGPAPWDIGRDRAYWEATTLTPTIADWKMPL